MGLYILEGRRLASAAEPDMKWNIEENNASAAMKRAALEAMKDSQQSESLARLHFKLMLETSKGTQTVLTVIGSGHNWSEAVKDAYERICYWQGQEPEQLSV